MEIVTKPVRAAHTGGGRSGSGVVCWGEGEPAWWLNLQAHPDVRVDLARPE